MSKFVTASPKRLESFVRFNLVCHKPNLTLRPLCPSHWVSRRFCQQLRKAVGLAMRHVQLDRCRCQTKMSSPIVSFIIGEVLSVFYLRIMQLLLRNFHAVHVAIQSRTLSMSMAKQLISKLSNVLQIESSSDEKATDFYQQVTRSASSIGVRLPSLPRCSGSRSQRQISLLSVNSYYSSLYSTIFKSAHNLLTTRFLMNGIEVVIDLENDLNLAGNEQTTQNIAEFYESDVDLSMLNTELAQIHLMHSNNVKSPDDLYAQFCSNNELPLFPIWQHY